ncbi:bifunctional DNA primase/polymerase [Kitasatospora sp. NPDC008050]|uniref:bifunctional DNA primase/polymerase n=1 Tax=Kitasatospora sp. NPDC008050 TaxID=3364021 RepID=UPI0036E64939
MTTQPHLLTAALAAAERGWQVFPLLPDSKRPAVAAWEQRATTDPDRIRRCWSTGPFNIAIACGPSRLVVADLDIPKPGTHPPAEWDKPGITDGTDVFAELFHRAGQPVPDQTFRVRTRSGGRHLYYRAPEHPAQPNTVGTFGWAIDTRATGGYVVAAGSQVDGVSYLVELDLPPLPLPGSLLISKERGPAGPAPAPTPGRISDPAAWANAALDRECDKVATTGEGGRNHALLGAARSLARMIATHTLTRHQVEDRLMDAAHAAGLHEKEAARTIRSGLDWGLTHTTARPAA